MMEKLLEVVLKSSHKPQLFEAGEPKFWDDPYIAKSMLEAHLSPDHDAASRRPEIIDKTIGHLLASGLLRPGSRVLDLGCGPGLYAERLADKGIQVTGLDISRGSLDYAIQHAKEKGLRIDYHCLNFLEMDYAEEFDAVLQVYGEICAFSDKKRDALFKKIQRALKKGGWFIFDVSTRRLRKKAGLKNGWYAADGGFWRPGKHLLLGQGFDYPAQEVWLDQYIVIDDRGVAVYRNWFHDYSLDTIRDVLENAGFEMKQVWNDLTGAEYTGDGDWIGIAAVKSGGLVPD